mgnify:CR=1 FL=1
MNCKMENKKIDKSKVKPNGVNKILCGACQEVLASLKEESVDLTVTSPPYDNIRDYKGYSFEEEDFKAIITQLFRVTKKGGVVVWIVGDATMKGSESGTSFRQALGFMEAGFKLHDTMIYEKNTSSFPAKRTGKRYTQIFEYMFVFSKGKVKTHNPMITRIIARHPPILLGIGYPIDLAQRTAFSLVSDSVIGLDLNPLSSNFFATIP